MPEKCLVPKCSNRVGGDHKSFHKFPPPGKEILKQWISFVGKPASWTPKNQRICSDHFEASCFKEMKNKRTRLKVDAVPSIQLSPQKTRGNTATTSEPLVGPSTSASTPLATSREPGPSTSADVVIHPTPSTSAAYHFGPASPNTGGTADNEPSSFSSENVSADTETQSELARTQNNTHHLTVYNDALNDSYSVHIPLYDTDKYDNHVSGKASDNNNIIVTPIESSVSYTSTAVSDLEQRSNARLSVAYIAESSQDLNSRVNEIVPSNSNLDPDDQINLSEDLPQPTYIQLQNVQPNTISSVQVNAQDYDYSHGSLPENCQEPTTQNNRYNWALPARKRRAVTVPESSPSKTPRTESYTDENPSEEMVQIDFQTPPSIIVVHNQPQPPTCQVCKQPVPHQTEEALAECAEQTETVLSQKIGSSRDGDIQELASRLGKFGENINFLLDHFEKKRRSMYTVDNFLKYCEYVSAQYDTPKTDTNLVWSVQFDQISNKYGAIELFNFISLLNPDNIPKYLLKSLFCYPGRNLEAEVNELESREIISVSSDGRYVSVCSKFHGIVVKDVNYISHILDHFMEKINNSDTETLTQNVKHMRTLWLHAVCHKDITNKYIGFMTYIIECKEIEVEERISFVENQIDELEKHLGWCDDRFMDIQRRYATLLQEHTNYEKLIVWCHSILANMQIEKDVTLLCVFSYANLLIDKDWGTFVKSILAKAHALNIEMISQTNEEISIQNIFEVLDCIDLKPEKETVLTSYFNMMLRKSDPEITKFLSDIAKHFPKRLTAHKFCLLFLLNSNILEHCDKGASILDIFSTLCIKCIGCLDNPFALRQSIRSYLSRLLRLFISECHFTCVLQSGPSLRALCLTAQKLEDDSLLEVIITSKNFIQTLTEQQVDRRNVLQVFFKYIAQRGESIIGVERFLKLLSIETEKKECGYLLLYNIGLHYFFDVKKSELNVTNVPSLPDFVSNIINMWRYMGCFTTDIISLHDIFSMLSCAWTSEVIPQSSDVVQVMCAIAACLYDCINTQPLDECLYIVANLSDSEQKVAAAEVLFDYYIEEWYEDKYDDIESKICKPLIELNYIENELNFKKQIGLYCIMVLSSHESKTIVNKILQQPFEDINLQSLEFLENCVKKLCKKSLNVQLQSCLQLLQHVTSVLYLDGVKYWSKIIKTICEAGMRDYFLKFISTQLVEPKVCIDFIITITMACHICQSDLEILIIELYPIRLKKFGESDPGTICLLICKAFILCQKNLTSAATIFNSLLTYFRENFQESNCEDKSMRSNIAWMMFVSNNLEVKKIVKCDVHMNSCLDIIVEKFSHTQADLEKLIKLLCHVGEMLDLAKNLPGFNIYCNNIYEHFIERMSMTLGSNHPVILRVGLLFLKHLLDEGDCDPDGPASEIYNTLQSLQGDIPELQKYKERFQNNESDYWNEPDCED